jgi:hypothetical protein
LRALPVLSYDPVSPRDACFYFSFHTFAASSSPATTPDPFHVTCPGGYGELGHLRLAAVRARRSRGSRSRTSTPQGCGVAATPVVIDQCQQPTILFSRDGNPSSRFTSLRESLRVTMAHGPRRIEPAPVNMSSCRESCPLAPPYMCSGHASSPHGSPAERSLWTTEALLHDDCVHRRSPLTSRRSAESSGYPPMV